MAKYYLLNAVTVRATQMWPGSEINDLCDDVASITSAGGKFIGVAEPGAAAASALAMNLKKNGGAIADAAAAMQIAYSASEGADFSDALSAAIGTEVSNRNSAISSAIGAIPSAGASTGGLLTDAQAAKLAGIAAGATANTLAVGTITGTAGDGAIVAAQGIITAQSSRTVQCVATAAITSLTGVTNIDGTPVNNSSALFPIAGTGTAGVDYFVGRYTYNGTTWTADPLFVVGVGIKIRCIDGRAWVQGAPVGGTPVFTGGAINGSRTPLTAASGVHVLLSIPIAVSTDNMITVTWGCYDGTATNRVRGTQCVTVIRGTGAAAIPAGGNVVGADFVDTSALLVAPYAPWAPTCALDGNNLEIRLTADLFNGVVPGVSAAISSKSNADAPAAVNLIVALRAALVATGFTALQLDAYLGLTPASPSPGTAITAIADASSNHFNGAKGGTADAITYQVDGSGRPYLLFPATNTGFDLAGGGLGASKTQTFAFCCELGTAAGTAIQLILCTTGTARYIAIDWASPGGLYYSDGAGKHCGNSPTGLHFIVIVVDAVNATPYIDGVAGTPVAITTAGNNWNAATRMGGSATGTAYPLQNAKWHCTYVGMDALNTAARVAAFDAYCTTAFGAHA